jgi:hypothetical protein
LHEVELFRPQSILDVALSAFCPLHLSFRKTSEFEIYSCLVFISLSQKPFSRGDGPSLLRDIEKYTKGGI